jgi:hypothetical protein
MTAIANTLPQIQVDMHQITGEMVTMEESMGLVGRGMTIIDQRVHAMTAGVAVMRENVGQIARPMGGMMPFMP